MTVRFITADVLDGLAQLPDESVHCAVTSPPYWGLRDYGTGRWEGGDPACDHRGIAGRGAGDVDNKHANGAARSASPARGGDPSRCECGATRIDRQIGLEHSLDEHLHQLGRVFSEVRRVLRKDGTFWLNYGDAYAGSWGAQGRQGESGEMASRSIISARQIAAAQRKRSHTGSSSRTPGLKPKDLMMLPARVALMLQASGWWLRADIIWHKLNPMPESCQDRPTSAHEHVFLLTKSARYFYDAEAVRETSITNDVRRPYGSEGAWQLDGRPPEQRPNGQPRKIKIPGGWDTEEGAHGTINRQGRTSAQYHEIGTKGNANGFRGGSYVNGKPGPRTATGNVPNPTHSRNMRNVWSVATEPFGEAHFATMPTAIAERCIKAGCPVGGMVLDPFAGAGTTLLVADRLGRDAIGIELNPEYVAMAERRIARDRLERGQGTMADVAASKLPLTPLEALIMEGTAA